MNAAYRCVYNGMMIAKLFNRYLVVLSIVSGVLFTSLRAVAHIVSIDNVLDIVADRDHATGELMVPLSAMVTWSAGLAGRSTPDKPDDQLAYAKAQADKLVSGLNLTYGDVEMDAKVTDTTIRIIDRQLSEDSVPEPIVIYKIDFKPKEKLASAPAEISFGHSLLAVPEEFQQLDVIIMCIVRFRQVDSPTVKTEPVATDDHVTFKCKWPAHPTSAPAKN